jgi:hypothetical protein
MNEDRAQGPASDESSTTTTSPTLPAEAEKSTLNDAVANADPWWSDGAFRAVVDIAKTRLPFEAYDVQVGYALPEPHHPSAWGAVFRIAYERGIIVPAGAMSSRKPSRHGSLVRLWRGAPTRAQ